MSGKTGMPGRVAVGKFVCTYCKLGTCDLCLDIKRSIYSSERLCQCQKKDHEPALSAVTSARNPSEPTSTTPTQSTER